MATDAVVKIVGVSNYKDAVAGLYEGATVMVEHEPSNEYDPNARMVRLDNNTVGYLPKELAAELVTAGAPPVITAEVIATTEYEGQVVGGIIRFLSDVPWLSINSPKEEDMGTRVSDALIEQGREAWEGRASRIRAHKLPSNRPITVIPLTDPATQEKDGGWWSGREVAAFSGIRFGHSIIKMQDEKRADLIFFPAKDFVEVTGSDGKPKMRGVTDPILERVVPSEYDLKKPKGADDDWQPPKYPRPSKMTYVNCIFMSGDLETGDRAKYNPKPGDHILLKMSTTWYEQWMRLIDRDRKKIPGYDPSALEWTLKISGQIGSLAFEADDTPVEEKTLEAIRLNAEVVNLDEYMDTLRVQVEQWVAANDSIESGVFQSVDDTQYDRTPAVNDSDLAAFEEAIQSIATADQVEPVSDDRSWSDMPPALMKKLLTENGIDVPSRPTKDQLIELCKANDGLLRQHLAKSA